MRKTVFAVAASASAAMSIAKSPVLMPRYLRVLRLSVALGLALPLTVLAQPSELGTFTTFNFPGAAYTQARYLDSSGEIVGFYFEGPAFASLTRLSAEQGRGA